MFRVFCVLLMLLIAPAFAVAQPGLPKPPKPEAAGAAEGELPRGAAVPVTKTDRNGNVTFVCSEVAGKLTGLCGTYFPDGTKKTDQTFVNGKVSGPFKVYWEDGETVHTSCNYVNGVPVGHWYNYFEDGKTIATHYFFDAAGAKHGPQWDWWPNGVLNVFAVWDHGEPVNTKIYDETGKLVEEWDGWGPAE